MNKNKILAVAHTKGGVGKTTILVQIAISLLLKGYKVRVADCDPNKVASFISRRRQKNTNVENFDSTVINSVSVLESFCNYASDEITIIDTAGVDCTLTRKAIELASIVLTPIAPSTTEFIGFATFKKVVQSLRVENEKIKLIINQAHPLCKIDKDYTFFKEQLNSPFDFLNTNIIRISDFDTSLSSGLGVGELNQNSKANIRIERVVLELLKLLEV